MMCSTVPSCPINNVVTWLGEPLADWCEEVRAVPRNSLEGVFSGHSVEGARTIKLTDNSFAVPFLRF